VKWTLRACTLEGGGVTPTVSSQTSPVNRSPGPRPLSGRSRITSIVGGSYALGGYVPGMAEPENSADLYAVTPDRFVAERNALAKRFRADGDKEQADQVRKLKKPSVSAWAVNAAARADPAAARRLIESGARLAAAQQGAQGKGNGGTLRRAMAGNQAAVEAMMEAVQEALRSEDQDRPAYVDRARETLRAVATDEELRNEFEAGRVVKDREAVGFGSAPATGPPRPSAETKVSEQARRKQRQRLKAAERAQATASKRVERARERRDRAQQDLDKAQEALDSAEAELKRATRELDAAKDD
jgi:hypothetical protein